MVVERIDELRAALKSALDILGHPDDATVQALRAVLESGDWVFEHVKV